MLKFISWNVNGLRAVLKKNFKEVFDELDADFFCLQETKLQEGQVELELPGYFQYWNYAERKGYSGTAVFTKHRPQSVTRGIGVDEFDHEGRVITLEYEDFFLVCCYTPNSQPQLKRLEFRMGFEEAFLNYLNSLKEGKPVIMCGDLNVAHEEIDLKNPKANRRNAGFSDEERSCMTRLLASGYTDTFRLLHPDEAGIYSWWSYRFNARKNNAGWRIDYFIIADSLRSSLKNAEILTDITGSDHCPVLIETADLKI